MISAKDLIATHNFHRNFRSMTLDLAMRRLVPIYAVVFLRFVSLGIFGPVLPLYVKSLGISVANWAMLAATFGAGMLVFEPLWGFLSDRVGRKVFLVTSSLFLTLVSPLYSIMRSVPLFLTLEFSRGALIAMCGPTTRAYVCETTSPERLGTAMGLLWASSGMGFMVGSFLGGSIGTMWTYEVAFYVCSVFSLIGGILTFSVLKDSDRSQQEKIANLDRSETHRSGISLRNLGGLLAQPQYRRNVVLLLLLAPISMMGGNLIQSFLPLLVVERFSASSVEVGAILAAFRGFSAFTMPLFGRFSERVGRRAVIVTGFSTYAVSVLCYAFAGSIDVMFVATAAAALSFSLMGGALLASFGSSVTRTNYGLAMGVYGAFEDVGVIVAPILYGALWSAFTSVSAIYACSILNIVGAILGSLLSGKVSRARKIRQYAS